eukprot:2242920-Rhodomonas_salina.2
MSVYCKPICIRSGSSGSIRPTDDRTAVATARYHQPALSPWRWARLVFLKPVPFPSLLLLQAALVANS